jgi:hypothetical protein
MHAGEQYSVGAGASGTGAASSTDQARSQTADTGETARRDQPTRPAASRLLMALVWALGAAGVFVLFLRVSLTSAVSSDAANNALQAWDLLHGHLLLHGWLIGDATYYTFDLPVIALAEVFFGLHTIAMHVAIALIYLIVAIAAVAIAVTGASGAAARLSRAAVVVAILAAPALILSDRWVTLGIPDHTGSTIFLLVPALLVDRVTTRRWGAPLLCVILTAGQIGDVTVRYVAVPAVCLVCAYHLLAARKIRSGDTAMLVAALVSLPLTTAVRAVMRHFGSYLMVSPHTKLAPVSQWPHNAGLAWHSIRELFGVQAAPDKVAGHWAVFGAACLIVAAAGLLWVLVRWPRARRAEQVLAVAIVANLAVYVVSTLPGPNAPHDIVAVLPAGAVLAARLLVPARLTGRGPARLPRLAAAAVVGAAAIAALLPLSVIAAKPSAGEGGQQQLVDWLQSHGLSYGLGGYWNASAVTLLSSDAVQIRTIKFNYGPDEAYALPYPWEASTFWYDPARHYADFVVVQNNDPQTVLKIENYFGRPVLTHHVGGPGGIEVLVYHKNLLTQVRQFSQLKPPVMPPVS